MTRASDANVQAEDDRGSGFEVVSSWSPVIGVAWLAKEVLEFAGGVVD